LKAPQNKCITVRVRPNIGFGYGYGAETATFLGFGLVTFTAVIKI